MTEQETTRKAKLTADIERTWLELNAALEAMSDKSMTTIRDAEGWTVKDHIIHLAVWERSVLSLLQGRTRYEGLGVDEALYRSGDVDAINAAVQQNWELVSLEDVLMRLREIHGQFMLALEKLSDADLQRPYTDFLPTETGLSDGRLLIDVIVGNTVDHYPEHLGWIETLVGQK